MGRLPWLDGIAVVFAAACGSTTGPAMPDAKILTLESIAITPSTLMTKVNLDLPTQLTATAMLSDGTTRDITHKAMWSSSDASIAKVADGLVTALAKGTTTVTAMDAGRAGMLVVNVDLATIAVSSFNGGVDFFSAGAALKNTPPWPVRRGATTPTP